MQEGASLKRSSIRVRNANNPRGSLSVLKQNSVPVRKSTDQLQTYKGEQSQSDSGKQSAVEKEQGSLQSTPSGPLGTSQEVRDSIVDIPSSAVPIAPVTNLQRDPKELVRLDPGLMRKLSPNKTTQELFPESSLPDAVGLPRLDEIDEKNSTRLFDVASAAKDSLFTKLKVGARAFSSTNQCCQETQNYRRYVLRMTSALFIVVKLCHIVATSKIDEESVMAFVFSLLGLAFLLGQSTSSLGLLNNLAPEKLSNLPGLTANHLFLKLLLHNNVLIELMITTLGIGLARKETAVAWVFQFLSVLSLQTAYFCLTAERQEILNATYCLVQAANIVKALPMVWLIFQEGPLALCFFGILLGIVYCGQVLIIMHSLTSMNAINQLNFKVANLQLDLEGVLQNLPEGVIIYDGEQQRSSIDQGSFAMDREDHKEFSASVKFINKEIQKTLWPNSSETGEFDTTLFQSKVFRNLDMRKDGDNDGEKYIQIDSARFSLHHILYVMAAKNKPLYIQYDVTNHSQFQQASDCMSLNSSSMMMTDRTSYGGRSTTMTFEVSCKPIFYKFKNSHMLLFKNLSQIIENQNMKMQKYYQDAMVSTISHEQMNPLNSIVNFTRYLRMQSLRSLGKEDSADFLDEMSCHFSDDERELDSQNMVFIHKLDVENQAKVAQIILNSAEQMQMLNQAIQSQNNINRPDYEPNMRVETDIIGIIKSFARLFNENIKSKNLDLHICEVESKNPELRAKLMKRGILLDQDLYQQILYNIFANACKFNKKNGRIIIRVNLIQPPELSDNVILETEIEDNGVGMTKQKRRSVFKMFDNVKGDKDRGNQDMQATSGCGLGLYLSFQLAKFLNGNVSIKSTEGQGTTVTTCIKVKFPSNIADYSLLLVDQLSSESRQSRSNPKAKKETSLKAIYNDYKQQANILREPGTERNRIFGRKRSSSSVGLHQGTASSPPQLPLHRSNTNKRLREEQKSSPKIGSIMDDEISHKKTSGGSHSQSFRANKPLHVDPFKDQDPHQKSNFIIHYDNIGSVSNSISSPTDKGTAQEAPTPMFVPSLRAADITSSKFDEVLPSSSESRHSSNLVGMQFREEGLHLYRDDGASQFRRQTTDQYTISSDGGGGLAVKLGQLPSQNAHPNLENHNKDYLVFDTRTVNSPTLPQKQNEKTQDELKMMLKKSIEKIELTRKKIVPPLERGNSTYSFGGAGYNHIVDNLSQSHEEVKSVSVTNSRDVMNGDTLKDFTPFKAYDEDDEEEDGINSLMDQRNQQRRPGLRTSNTFAGITRPGRLNVVPIDTGVNSPASGKLSVTKTPYVGCYRGSSIRIQRMTSGEIMIQFDKDQMSPALKMNHCTCPQVLVVDDSVYNREVLSLIITRSFYFKADEADDGAVALEKFISNFENTKGCSSKSCQKPKYKLIFMDINMPTMDGLEATKEIYKYLRRKNAADHKITILAQTAFSNKTDQCKAAGMVEVLNKPVNNETVCNRILKYCPGLEQKKVSSPVHN